VCRRFRLRKAVDAGDDSGKKLLQKLEAEEQKRLAEAKERERRKALEQEMRQKQIEASKIRAELFHSDPAKSYKEFCSNFMSSLSNYKFYPDYNVYSKYKMNLQETGNMLRPVIGTLNFHTERYTPEFNQILLYHEYFLTFAPDGNKWVLESAKYMHALLEEYGFKEIKSGSKDLEVIIKAYSETPNP
jgi:hypothetical protein